MEAPRQGQLQKEIGQSRPFRSRTLEAALSVVRTAELINRRHAAAVAPFEVTPQQFNVLRILRGAGGKPLTPTQIIERMVEQTPGVTRFLDRLEERGFIRRERCQEDRRQVHCFITEAGLELLTKMDEPVESTDEATMFGLSEKDLDELISLLDRVRVSWQ